MAQRIRDGFPARFRKQLSAGFIREPVTSRGGDLSGVKIVVGQFEPAFQLRNEQCSIAFQRRVDAAHIQLFNTRSGRMESQAAERANFLAPSSRERP